jgi:hypothetical protein
MGKGPLVHQRPYPGHGMTFEGLRDVAMALPEVEEGTSWGTLAYKVRKKMICRVHDKLIDVLVVRIDMADREYLIASRPDVYFTLPHYDGYPAVLVRLPVVERDELRRLLTAAWRFVAPPKLVAGLGGRL